MDITQTRNARGEWVPAIPLPYQFPARVRCAEHRDGDSIRECEERWNHLPTRRGRAKALRLYREHYALVHILGLD